MSTSLLARAMVASIIAATTLNAAGKISVKSAVTYHGWTDAVVLGNGTVEAIVVPSVGRLMQFRFTGAADGPFWENPKLAGKAMPEKPWKPRMGASGGTRPGPPRKACGTGLRPMCSMLHPSPFASNRTMASC